LILKNIEAVAFPNQKAAGNFRAAKKKTTGKPLQTGDRFA
jgi:hypothetical protein